MARNMASSSLLRNLRDQLRETSDSDDGEFDEQPPPPAPPDDHHEEYHYMDHDAEDEDDPDLVAIACNEAYQDVLKESIRVAEEALNDNLQEQTRLRRVLESMRLTADADRCRFPVMLFLKPYFKDEQGNGPPWNEEQRRWKTEVMNYDPLVEPERTWTPREARELSKGVERKLREQRLVDITCRREILAGKIEKAHAATNTDQVQQWKNELAAVQRKIEYVNRLPTDELIREDTDFGGIDWTDIALNEFKGARSPETLRLQWLNNLQPSISKSPWTKEEGVKLKELVRKAAMSERGHLASWETIAYQLGTNRTAFQCCQKYMRESTSTVVDRPWTVQEDDKLRQLVRLHSSADGVHIDWSKVTFEMANRSRRQCRIRWLERLADKLRHGRWTREEDLALLCGVGRYGISNWPKVAEMVACRSMPQCRDRWLNVLDRSTTCRAWSMAEDELLLLGVRVFGRGEWSKIGLLLPDRTGPLIRGRYRRLLNVKVRICQADLGTIERRVDVRQLYAVMKHHSAYLDDLYATFNSYVGGDDPHGLLFTEAIRDKFGSQNNLSAEDVIRREMAAGRLRSADGEVLLEEVSAITTRHRQLGRPSEAEIHKMLGQMHITQQDVEEVMARTRPMEAGMDSEEFEEDEANEEPPPSGSVNGRAATLRFPAEMQESDRVRMATEALLDLVDERQRDDFVHRLQDSTQIQELIREKLAQKLRTDIDRALDEYRAAGDDEAAKDRVSNLLKSQRLSSSPATQNGLLFLQSARDTLLHGCRTLFPVVRPSNAKNKTIEALQRSWGTRHYIALSDAILNSDDYLKLKWTMQAMWTVPSQLDVTLLQRNELKVRSTLNEAYAKLVKQDADNRATDGGTNPETERIEIDEDQPSSSSAILNQASSSSTSVAPMLVDVADDTAGHSKSRQQEEYERRLETIAAAAIRQRDEVDRIASEIANGASRQDDDDDDDDDGNDDDDDDDEFD